MIVDPSARFVYVANFDGDDDGHYPSGSVSCYRIESNGNLQLTATIASNSPASQRIIRCNPVQTMRRGLIFGEASWPLLADMAYYNKVGGLIATTNSIGTFNDGNIRNSISTSRAE